MSSLTKRTKTRRRIRDEKKLKRRKKTLRNSLKKRAEKEVLL